METNILIVGKRTAHLLNARKLLEQLQEEVCDAYQDLGENEVQARLWDLQAGADQIRDYLDRWLAEQVTAWAVSRPLQAEI